MVLPGVLEHLLGSLSCVNNVQTWNIYQEKNGGAVVVKIRFSGQDCDMGDKQISYKKKSDKQAQRDADRVKDFQRQTRSKSKQSINVEEIENIRGDCDLSSMSANTGMSSPSIPVHSPVSTSELSPIRTDLESPPPMVDINKTLDHVDSKSDTDQLIQGDVPPVTLTGSDVPPLPAQVKERNLPDKCEICGLGCDMFWRRCTHTDHHKLFSVCNTCYHNESHTEHPNQITQFILPPYAKYKCESCGEPFENKLDEVNKCTKCQDYLLCNRCFKSSKHKGHAFFIEKTLMGRLY